MSRFNIFEKNWLDTVFEGRNKTYGAYKMREDQSGIMVKAFFIGTAIFGSIISIPVISNALSKPITEERERVVLYNASDVFITPKDEKVEEIIPPKVEKKQKPKTTVVRYTAPEPADESEAVDILTQEDLKNVDIGREDLEGDEDGEIIIDEEPVKTAIKTDVDVTEGSTKIFSVMNVQVKPEPKGGMKAFYKFIGDNFKVPELGTQTTLKIYVSFIVDIDGSLTDIQILKDMGYGTGEEALRVLKKSGKWNPGIQNNANVRVRYQLPIILKIN